MGDAAAGRREQLQMLWPEERANQPPAVVLPKGYVLRTYRPGDEAEHVRVMRAAGFSDWSEERLRGTLLRVLPGGFFLVTHAASGALAATAMAVHNPSDLHPFGGELGWVAGDPAHARRGLGRAVTAAVVVRFLRAGYTRIYLKTDDYRLPAIKTYLALGWAPFLFAADMRERWRTICGILDWPFTPDAWPSVVTREDR